MNIIEGKNIKKSFDKDGQGRMVLNDISIEIKTGEFVSIMGPSGSGKSTLMYVLSGMDHIDHGQILFDQRDLSTYKEYELADMRREAMGFVFQQPTFISNLNLLDNIILPAVGGSKVAHRSILAKAKDLMARMGIDGMEDRETFQVSGGQLQRAGICRALINSPAVIFGDEPTGALNSASSLEIMQLLCQVNQDGTTIILVTHDAKVAAMSERVLFINDGKILEDLVLGKFSGDEMDTRLDQVSVEMRKLGI